MFVDLLLAVLLSMSPFGEAKVGIPYGILNGVNKYVVFIFCILGNLLIFPMMMFFLEKVNRYFIKWRFYKIAAVYIGQRAKKASKSNIQKYGLIGLTIFVMLPLPGTGVYAGTIASYLFKFEKQKAFLANAIGIFFSSVIVWTATLLSVKGL